MAGEPVGESLPQTDTGGAAVDQRSTGRCRRQIQTNCIVLRQGVATFFFFLNSHVTITKGKNGEWTWNDKNNRKNETNKNWAEINCFFVCSVMIVCFKLLNGRLSLIEWKFCRSTGKTGAIEWMWKREPIGACRSTGGWRPPDDTPVSPSTFCWHEKKMKINFWIILH